jgi:hypothetical protein
VRPSIQARDSTRGQIGQTFIEGQIEHQHVHHRFPEETERPPLSMLSDQISHLLDRHTAGARDPNRLNLGVARADVRIRTRMRSSHRRELVSSRGYQRRFFVVERPDQLHIVERASSIPEAIERHG